MSTLGIDICDCRRVRGQSQSHSQSGCPGRGVPASPARLETLTIHSPTVALLSVLSGVSDSPPAQHSSIDMIRVSTLLLPVVLLVLPSLSTATSLSTKDGGHHPNSVYAQISAHKKKDLRIFYQNGVSQVFPGYWSLASVTALLASASHVGWIFLSVL